MDPQGTGAKGAEGYLWVVAKLWGGTARALPSPLPEGMSFYEFPRGVIVRFQEISKAGPQVVIDVPKFVREWDDVEFLLEGAESCAPAGSDVRRGTIICATRGAPLRPACLHPFPEWPNIHAVFNTTNELATLTSSGGVIEVSIWRLSVAGNTVRVFLDESWNDRTRSLPSFVNDTFHSGLSLVLYKEQGDRDVLYMTTGRYEPRRARRGW